MKHLEFKDRPDIQEGMTFKTKKNRFFYLQTFGLKDQLLASLGDLDPLIQLYS